MSDIEVFKPKTSSIDVLNNYKFTEDEIKKLECVYTKEWDLYVKGLTQFIDQSILDKIEGIKLCVSKITTGDPDKWIDTNEVFSEAKHQAFVKWLFKSHIMALRDCDRAIGNSIDHHLPILFRIYINEGRYKRLLSEDLPETAKIEDFNKLTKLVIDTLNESIGPYFELDVVSGVTTEDRFQYIPVNVKMKTIYQESEDAYIKSFLAHLVVERNKQTGLEEFHSIELFGFGKKKENKSENNVDFEKLPGYKKEIFEKCISLFKRAWNYKAYKLPTDMGKIQPGYEDQFDNEDEINERREECGFNKYIGEEEGHWIDRDPTVKSDKLIISGEGIFDFAYGQPTEFTNYNKTLKDISTRWGKRLSEKEPIVKEYLSKFYNNISVRTNVGTGDGDEGCVYPEYTIEIPISELQKPIKKSKEELLKLCEMGSKILMKAFQKNGNPKGFTLRSKDEINDEIRDYLSDDDDSSITIGDIDAWEFTNGKARDESEYEKFNNALINIENDIKRLMKQMNYPCNITSDGSDWDDGCFWINLDEQPDFKEIKNHMN